MTYPAAFICKGNLHRSRFIVYFYLSPMEAVKAKHFYGDIEKILLVPKPHNHYKAASDFGEIYKKSKL